MADTLQFDVYDPGTVTRTYAVNSSNVGGDTEQLQVDGINNLGEEWSIKMDKKKGADVDSIRQFLESHLGFQSFYWTPPNGQQGRYVCTDLSVTFDYHTAVESLTARLKKVNTWT